MFLFWVVQGFLKEVKRWKWNKFQGICLGIPEKKTKKSQKWSKFIESGLFVPCRGCLCFRVQFWLPVLCFASFVLFPPNIYCDTKTKRFFHGDQKFHKAWFSSLFQFASLITSSHDVILWFSLFFFGLFGAMEPTHVCLIYYIWILPTLYDRGYNVASINLKCWKEANKIHYDILVFPTKKSWPDMSTEKAISNLRLKNPWNIYHRFPCKRPPPWKKFGARDLVDEKDVLFNVFFQAASTVYSQMKIAPWLGAQIIGTMEQTTTNRLYPTENI